MLKVASYDIVFQEIPGEVTLALNLSGCPCHCAGCHSQHLWEDVGEELTPELLEALMEQYAGLITCVCFMGGDQAPEEVLRLAEHIQMVNGKCTNGTLHVAWYSGRLALPECLIAKGGLTAERSNSVNGLTGVAGPFDYIKLGPYIEALGGLKSPTTNQRLYKRVGQNWEDITALFWQKRFE